MASNWAESWVLNWSIAVRSYTVVGAFKSNEARLVFVSSVFFTALSFLSLAVFSLGISVAILAFVSLSLPSKSEAIFSVNCCSLRWNFS